jgi:hypothetical protein
MQAQQTIWLHQQEEFVLSGCELLAYAMWHATPCVIESMTELIKSLQYTEFWMDHVMWN